MSDYISAFFEAWQIEDPKARLEKITSAVTEAIQYDDPRTSDTIQGINTLSDYVGMFSANAPGWAAKVVASDTSNGMTRSTVAFSGIGPDGSEQTQYGQYFVEQENGLISRMVGFVGVGKLE
jgi:hypothetical protein